jgi:hypothetical protein
MRSSLSLFVVSALLFVCGLGLVVIGARTARTARAAAAPSSAPAAAPAVATTKQIMSGIVTPTSNAIFQAVQTNVTLQGTEEIYPRSDEEWAQLGAQAASLAEAGALLMAEGRAIDRGEWITMSQAMIDAAMQTMRAVEKKQPEEVLAAGEVVNASCDTCHLRYRRE